MILDRVELLEVLKDPKFREQFKELLNKKDDPDEIHILFRVRGSQKQQHDDRVGDYVITTVKRRNKFSSIPMGELPLNEKLLRSLYEQLIEHYKKKENLK